MGHIGEITVVVGSEVQRAIDTLFDDRLFWTAYLHLVPLAVDRSSIRIGILTLPLLDDPLSIAIRLERSGGHYRPDDNEVD